MGFDFVVCKWKYLYIMSCDRDMFLQKISQLSTCTLYLIFGILMDDEMQDIAFFTYQQ